MHPGEQNSVDSGLAAVTSLGHEWCLWPCLQLVLKGSCWIVAYSGHVDLRSSKVGGIDTSGLAKRQCREYQNITCTHIYTHAQCLFFP